MSDQFFTDLENHLGASVDYLREMKSKSQSAFDKYTQVIPLAAHREFISKENSFIAHMLATVGEDCGPCAQIIVNLASKEDLSPAFMDAVVQARRKDLSDEQNLVYDFVQATVDNSENQNELREQVKDTLGEEALVDLGLAMASARIFPTVKRTMGFAKTCQKVTIEGNETNVAKNRA